jgi:hypothetical protein
MADILDIPVIPTSNSIRTGLMHVAILDPKNAGVSVRISLPSYIQAEIYVIVFTVNGGHLRFNSHPNVGEYPDVFDDVAGPKNERARRQFGDITFDTRNSLLLHPA